MKRNWILAMFVLFAVAAASAQTAADFTINEDGVITKYSGFDTDIVIPATIGGRKITAIGAQAFYNAELTSVIIPEGITSIGDEAFARNKLTSITIPGSVHILGQWAFSRNNLKTIVISEGVAVDNGAFVGNSAELTVTMPSSIRVLKYNYSSGSGGLGSKANAILAANINVDFNGLFYTEWSREAIFYQYIANDRKAGTYTPVAAYEKRANDFEYIETQYGTVLTRYIGNSTRVRIPAEIDGIPVKALIGTFRNTNQLDAVQIPESVTYIGAYTFSYKKLASITIPEGVTYIGDNAFDNGSLTSVIIPAGVTYIGNGAFSRNELANLTFQGNMAYINSNAFSRNKLTSVTIPAGITYIGERAFSGNQMTSVTIPAGVTYIGGQAFGYMNIRTITLPPSVMTLGGNPLFSSYADYGLSSDNFAHGMSIVIGANVDIIRGGSFMQDYIKNGRRAGRYTVAVNRGAGTETWTYNAR